MYFDSYATGKRIQQLRKANGMTQEQFAIELNTSDRHIRRIERGEETPSIDLYVEMVATFNGNRTYTFASNLYNGCPRWTAALESHGGRYG